MIYRMSLKKYRSLSDHDLASAAHQKLRMGEYGHGGAVEDREAVARLLAERDVFRAVTVIMMLIAGAAFIGVVSPLVTLAA